jgi:hypothetical protein
LSLLAMPCLAQTQSEQESHGACSPNLLKNLGTISITCNVLVATTPIGGTTVSAQSSSEALFRRANRSDSEVYVDKNLMFGISWPKNSSWQPSEKGKMDQSQVEPFGGITAFALANVINLEVGFIVVDVTPKVFFTIEEALHSFILYQKSRGLTVVSASIDQAHSGAILVLTDPKITRGNNAGMVRLLLGDAFTYYVIMADTYPQTQKYIKARNEANLICNSCILLHQ